MSVEMLAKGVKKATDFAQEKQAEIYKYADEARRYDDQTLLRRWKEASGCRKAGYMMELKNRGYGNQD